MTTAVLSWGTTRPSPSPGREKAALTWGGAKGTRTPNPLLAKQVRYQLRHGPWRRRSCARRVGQERVTSSVASAQSACSR